MATLDPTTIKAFAEKHFPAIDWLDVRDGFLSALALHWCMDQGVDLGVSLGGAKIGDLLTAAWAKRASLKLAEYVTEVDQRDMILWCARRVVDKRAGR